MSTSTEETTRIPPDGSVGPDSKQTKADQTRTEQDQTRTDQDQPESSQSHLDRSLQDPVTSRESPSQDPPPASDQDSSPGAEQERSTQAENTEHKDDSSVFKRPYRPSTQNKSIRAIATSPPPQRSAASSSLTNTNSVEVKEAAGAQVEREKVQVTKPPRQPPEVKPKPKSPALTGNVTFNQCPICTTTTTTETTTTTAVSSDNKEENSNMAEVKVDASLRTTPVERSRAAHGDNHNQPKQTTTQNSAVQKLASNLQTLVNHISTDKTQQNGRNVKSSNTVENNIVTHTDSTSLPVLQKYATNIISLEQISQKCNPKDNSATSDQTSTHLIQDTTSQNIILREKGNSSPNKMAEGINSNGSDVVLNNQGFEDFWTDFSQEPFIVVWDESIDIEATFNRLSTILECEEDLAKSRESVLNEDGSHAKMSAPVQFTFQGEVKEDAQVKKSDSKKKFKLKFPKNKLAQISRAIRTGSLRKAKKQDETEGNKHANRNKKMPFSSLRPKKQENELCKNAVDSIDSLEASVKQLEVSMDSFGVATSMSTANGGLERSEHSDRTAPQILKDAQPPQRKRLKPGREQTPLSRPRPFSDPQAPPTDLSLSPQISNRKRPSSHTHTGQVGPVSP
ncbi:hypothetical protein NQD34_013313 [Periophthalmus magnuspinnatus]|nr:hypothetical protein NQD34_013313 [Periophthalmus magnuspinnatus]